MSGPVATIHDVGLSSTDVSTCPVMEQCEGNPECTETTDLRVVALLHRDGLRLGCITLCGTHGPQRGGPRLMTSLRSMDEDWFIARSREHAAHLRAAARRFDPWVPAVPVAASAAPPVST